MVFVLAFLHLMLLVATLAVSIMGLTALAVIDGMVFLIMFGVWALVLERRERLVKEAGRQAVPHPAYRVKNPSTII